MKPLHYHHASMHCPGFIDIEDPSLRLQANEQIIYQRFFGYQKIASIQHKSMVDNLHLLIKQTLDETNRQASEIDCLIHVHTHQQASPYQQPHLSELKKRIPDLRCPCFGISINNCVSFFTAIEMTRAYFGQQDKPCHALILAADLVHTAFQRIIPQTAIMGECMTASWFSTTPSPHRLIAISHQTHGQYADIMHHHRPDGDTFEANYQQHLQSIIHDCTKKAGVKLHELFIILPHNVSAYSWRRFAHSIGLDQSRIYLDNIAEYGHCFNADPSINWASVDFKSRCPHGGTYLMVGVGLGATFAAAVWQYTPDA